MNHQKICATWLLINVLHWRNVNKPSFWLTNWINQNCPNQWMDAILPLVKSPVGSNSLFSHPSDSSWGNKHQDADCTISTCWFKFLRILMRSRCWNMFLCQQLLPSPALFLKKSYSVVDCWDSKNKYIIK